MSEITTSQQLNSAVTVAKNLLQSGQFAAAAACVTQLKVDNPDNKTLEQLSAQISGARNDPVGVLTSLKRAIENQPGIPQLTFGYIHALYSLGQLAEALVEIEKAQAPVGSPLRHNLNGLKVMCLQRHGTIDEITPVIKELTAAEGRTPRIITFEIELLQRQGKYEEAILESKKVLSQTSLSQVDRAKIGLGLARILDTTEQYDDAFAIASEVNNDASQQFNSTLYKEMIEQLISFFTPSTIDTLEHSDCMSEQPVFIVGMPRSGTSMLEQIIASHPECGGLGERQDPFILLEDLNYQEGKPYPQVLSSVKSTNLDLLASRYLDMIKTTGISGSRIVNKALGLEVVVGFLSVLLPKSRFIWIQRNPADNLLSIYLHTILKPWCWNLDDLIVVRQMHDKLCEHWQAVIPARHLNVSYESLTLNQEYETDRVISFLGLQPNVSTHSFHESSRTVMTPSANQVKRPMHREAVNRWKNYEAHLGSVISAFPVS